MFQNGFDIGSRNSFVQYGKGKGFGVGAVPLQAFQLFQPPGGAPSSLPAENAYTGEGVFGNGKGQKNRLLNIKV
jgi:hypothetical protein